MVQDGLCGSALSLPEARDGNVVSFSAVPPSTLAATFTCEAPGAGCGVWVKSGGAGGCAIDGVCGASSGAALAQAPTEALCSVGSASAVAGSGPWSWTCAGSNGGAAASCSATAACNPGSKPVDLVIVIDASASMQALIDAAKSAVQSIASTILAGRPNVTVTLTTFGGTGYVPDLYTDPRQACPIGRLTGPAPLDANAIATALGSLVSGQYTPFADGLTCAGQFVAGAANPVMIVLSDGRETCGGDVAASVAALKGKGITLFGIAYGRYAASSFAGFDETRAASTKEDVLAALKAFLTETICQTAPPAQSP
jgi:hypothetical protein